MPNLTQLIKDIKEKGITPPKLKGEAQPVLAFWCLVHDTELFPTSPAFSQLVGAYYAWSGGWRG